MRWKWLGERLSFLALIAFSIFLSGCASFKDSRYGDNNWDSTFGHDSVSTKLSKLQARHDAIERELQELESNEPPKEDTSEWIFFPLWHLINIETSKTTSASNGK